MYDLARGASRAIAVVGTAKNVGKTTTLAALRAVAEARGERYAVTSIGRDGEAFDAVDGLPKPRVHVPPGTIVTLPAALLPAHETLEILERGAPGALGDTLIARARAPVTCEVGGPPNAAAMRALLARLRELVPGPVFVDGAIDRIAALAGGDEAVILATGGGTAATLSGITSEAADFAARLRLRRAAEGEAQRARRIAGALTPTIANELQRQPRGTTVIVEDPTRIVLGAGALRRLQTTVTLRCEHPLATVACTTSPARAGEPIPARTLAEAVATATGLPTFDVVADVAALPA